MSARPALRDDFSALEGYHSPQVQAEVRLNTNESPFPPPESWREEFEQSLSRVQFNRYPDRAATDLRQGIAAFHGVTAAEVFCANGSNEALQCLLTAFGGPGRTAAVFEPTYALHRFIAQLAGTAVATGTRGPDFRIEPAEADRLLARARPDVTFLCSPNNPTGGAEAPDLVRHVLERAPSMVVVDEAYGQFAPWSALELRARAPGLVVVRTFSKTWAMAGARLGYLIAEPEVVAGCELVALPYHLSAQTQLAGILALKYRDEMEARVALVAEERGRVAAALADLEVEAWPSDSNFILFRPLGRGADEVWQRLVERSVLIRNCASWPGLDDCLRVTIGTAKENARFLGALEESLQ